MRVHLSGRFRRAALVAALAFSGAFACAPRVTPPAVHVVETGATTPLPAATSLAMRPTPAPLATLPPALPTPTPRADCVHEFPAPAPGAPLHTMRFFDIGQGDSELLQTASGKTVLIDAGPPDHSAALLRDLADAGVSRIDLLVASHPHLDHIGGMAAVLEKYPVRLYVDPGTEHATQTYIALLAEVKAKHVPYQILRAGKTLRLGNEATLTVLSPPVDHLIQTKRSPENANSLVIEVRIGSFHALLPGDAEPETLDALSPQVGHVDLLKVAHHGSRYGTSAEFLDAITPHIATISDGAGNDYKHPHHETLDLLRERCIATYRTDRDGTITLVTDGKGYRVTAERGTTPAQADPGIPGDAAGGPRNEAASSHAASSSLTATTATDGPVFASRRGKTYHPAGCSHLKRIKQENLVEYPSAADAIAAGLHAAKNCHVARDASGTGMSVDEGDDDARPKKSRSHHHHRSTR